MLGMVAEEDDVVVADVVGEEILFAYPLAVQAVADLGTAFAFVVLIVEQLAIAEEGLVQSAAAKLDNGDCAGGEYALDGDTALALEVTAYHILTALIEADGAMGKEHFVALGIEEGGIGHESVLTRETLAKQHGEDGLEVALAPGHDALVVEQSQGRNRRQR